MANNVYMRAFHKLILLLSFILFDYSCRKEPSIPVIETVPLTSVTTNSAMTGGNIISDGGASITSKGVCWSQNSKPTLKDNHIQSIEDFTFTCEINDLSPGTVYWVKAFATNSAGTGYGVAVRMKTYDGLVSDIDGNNYNIVKIGPQIWMGENLRVTRLSDGTEMQFVTGPEMWNEPIIPKYSFYILINGFNDFGSAIYKKSYGAYYNWYAILTGKLCPQGWHVSSDSEWEALQNFLGGSAVAGGKLKGINDWKMGEIRGSNESNFTGLPAGINGGQYAIGQSGYWWAVTGRTDYICYFMLSCYSNSVARYYETITTYPVAYSVRCVKD